MMNLSEKPDIWRILKYGIVGGTGAVIDFSLYAIFITFFNLPYLAANIISFSTGTLVVYILQKNWTFNFQEAAHREVFGKFLVVVIITFFLNNAILIVCISFLGIDPLVSKVIQILLSFLFGFTANSRFVFRGS